MSLLFLSVTGTLLCLRVTLHAAYGTHDILLAFNSICVQICCKCTICLSGCVPRYVDVCVHVLRCAVFVSVFVCDVCVLKVQLINDCSFSSDRHIL